MKKRLKHICLMIISFCVITAALPQMVFAADSEPPSVSSLILDKHNVKPGDSITITCNATDNVKIAEAVLTFHKGDHYTELISLSDQGKNTYKAVYKIPDTLVNGTYNLGYFSVSDTSGNQYVTYNPYDYPNMYFTVSDSSGDVSSPKVVSLSSDKEAVVPGDQVTLTCVVEDDSDLDTEITETYLYMENNGHYSLPFLFEKESKGVYTATQTIPSTYLNGTYRVSELVLTDLYGNTFRGGEEFSDVSFEVSGASGDSTAPVVLSAFADPVDVQAGDTVSFYLQVADDSAISLSPLRTYLTVSSGWFQSKVISFEQLEDGTLYGEITVDPSFRNGAYSLQILSISDVIGNTTVTNDPSLYPALSFTVSDNPVDPSHKEGWVFENGNWYFYNEKGEKVTGWLFDDAWYYLNSDGAMTVGWKLVSGVWYFFDVSGEMQTGWQNIDKEWYFFNEDGAMQSGWLFYQENWYYLNSSGQRQTGWKQIGNVWYFLKEAGVMAAEEWCNGYWLSSHGGWTYRPVGSWKHNAQGWWFGDTSGWYAKNESVKINNVIYSFDPDGYWVE